MKIKCGDALLRALNSKLKASETVCYGALRGVDPISVKFGRPNFSINFISVTFVEILFSQDPGYMYLVTGVSEAFPKTVYIFSHQRT